MVAGDRRSHRAEGDKLLVRELGIESFGNLARTPGPKDNDFDLRLFGPFTRNRHVLS